MNEQAIKLKDGRKLAFEFYGPDSGEPVFYFHGTPSSRLEPLILGIYDVDLDLMLQTGNIRLIAVDRPGMGLSDFNPKGDFLSFADDIAELAGQLFIRSSQVLCWSGGGPYALALAYKYPDLGAACHILCGFSRQFAKDVEQLMGMNKWYFILARRTPWLLRAAMDILKRKTAHRKLPQWITGLPHADYLFIRDPAKLEQLSSLSMKQAALNGAKGAVYEARGYYRKLGFHLLEIKVPVHYWWGTLDMSVIRLHAEEVERNVPNAIMHYREHEGHLSLFIRCFKDVITVMSSSGKRIAFNQ